MSTIAMNPTETTSSTRSATRHSCVCPYAAPCRAAFSTSWPARVSTNTRHSTYTPANESTATSSATATTTPRRSRATGAGRTGAGMTGVSLTGPR